MIALTRPVTDAIVNCELTQLERQPIDVGRARDQHAEYERCLEELGCSITRIDAPSALADAVFIEDAAVVFDEIAVITRPGAESRRQETAGVALALEPYRRLAPIAAPATLDGGDVLVAGARVFVGLSTRSNLAGVDQLREILAPFGYRVCGVEVGCLHLKTAVTAVADNLLLIDPTWIDVQPFAGFDLVRVDPSETYAANALRVGDVVVYPEAFPKTRERLRVHGLDVRTVPADELAKAEGGVTCCSLIFK